MARGKQTCKILKEIRRQIAEANDIEYVTSECRYKGDCLGTCPKCEAEVRYLEQQLRARSLAGKAIALAGISAGMILMSGCSGTSTNQSSVTLQSEPEASEELIEITDTIEKGELPAIEDTVIIKKEEIDDTESLSLIVGEIIDREHNDKPYEATVDVRPTFPGGDEKLMEWISQHLRYPQDAYDSHIQGSVIVQFLIKEDGSVVDAEIAKSVFPSLDKEAIRVVRGLPKFHPAILDGKAIDYWFTIPVVFRLEDDLNSHEAPTTNMNENKIIYEAVEQMPEFPGGQDEMLRFISQNLKYPEEQLKAEIQGRVFVKFYVDTLGRVCEPVITKGREPDLDREALRVVRLLPNFTPGTINGKKVNTYMVLPITFKLPAD